MQIYKLNKLSDTNNKISLPLYSSSVPAGFPSPAEDYIDSSIDLNKHLVPRPNSTFIVKVQGDSMIDAKITSGDILVIDKSLQPKNGQVILAIIDGEFTVKRYTFIDGKPVLKAENSKYPAIDINDNSNFQIWGVVTYVIHQCDSQSI
ncbi:MAG: translesion error-prone DNA polymerase V autoproteolytic subunit [Patescibacteria group bacterium]